MLALVETPRIKVEADLIPNELLRFLKEQYKTVTVTNDSDDELVEINKSDWNAKIAKTMTPAAYLKVYRRRAGLTQTELGRKLGNIPKQNISNMETGRRPISLAIAKRLAEFFNTSVETFL